MPERVESVMVAVETDVVRDRREAIRRRATRSDAPRRAHGERPLGRRVSTMCSTPMRQAGQRGRGALAGAGVIAGTSGAGSAGRVSAAAMSCSRAWASRSRREGLNRP